MNQLAESLSLVKFIERHNDPADPFHMSAHQVVSVGHQFSNGVSFLCATTPYLLGNMARAVNCGCQKQGHTDAAFNWCGKEIALVGFGMNRMGAHFNPVSLSIVNGLVMYMRRRISELLLCRICHPLLVVQSRVRGP